MGGPVEGPWALPEGWRWGSIGEVCGYISRGRSPTYVTEGGVRIINQKCVRWRGLDIAHVKRTASEAAARLAPEQTLQVGDTLWNSTGTGTIGRACVVRASDLDEISVADSHVTLLRPSGVEPFWLRYWIEMPFVQEKVTGTGSTNQVELSREMVLSMPLPLPQKGLQTTILKKMDDLFADLDDGEAALARARTDLGMWRKALLKAAVTGELTADWRLANPPGETGADLLARILEERRARWLASPRNRGKRYLEPTIAQDTDKSGKPPHWTPAKIEQISFVENGQTPKGIELETSKHGDLPWFKVSSMNMPGNEKELSASEWWLGHKQSVDLSLRLLPKGTIVFPKRGGSIFTEKKRLLAQESAIDLNLMGVVPLPSSRDHLWMFFQNLSLKSISDGSNVPQINYPDVAELVTWLPPSAEIAEINVRLLEALQQYEDTELALFDYFSATSTLRQSILATAFRGELVA